jgi:phosphinothricin acetyltransferase
MKKMSPADLNTNRVTIRPASLADLPQINRIYNHYVDKSSATFALAPESEENRLAWFKSHEQSGHPILSLVEDEAVIGWASLSAYNTRCGYAGTVELSIYLTKKRAWGMVKGFSGH